MKSKSLGQYRAVESLVNEAEDSINNISKDVADINNDDSSAELDSLTERISRLYEKAGAIMPELEELPEGADKKFRSCRQDVVDKAKERLNSGELKITRSQAFPDELSNIDIAMTCIAGGLAVLVDFLVVKVPKSVNIVRDGQKIHQQGSPMTGLLRQIGFDSDKKTSAWVKTLEKYFKVPYDKSIIAGEKGFMPRSHRLYSLAHDPSPSGFLWAMKDIICGTTSYIDKAGNLKMIPTHSASLESKLLCPIVWLGHIISDIFSKAGVPIPGMCLLRSLQVGSFGAKRRTLGQVVEYMYLEGYDLRHLATMSISNVAIELILRIYHVLTREYTSQFAMPAAYHVAEKSMYAHRLSKMRLGAYAVAATGNIAKMASYQWNPLALNLPVWIELLRTSILEYKRAYGTDSLHIQAVKNREEINQTFEELEERLKRL